MYKASLADNPTNSLPSSFSSTGTAFSSTSSSPVFNTSPGSSPSPLKTDGQASFEGSSLGPLDGASKSHSSSLTISASNATTFQLCSDFQPEWMNKEERPAKWARSSLPSATWTSTTNSSSTFQADQSWYPESLPGWVDNDQGTSQPAASARNNIAGSRTNASNTTSHSEAKFLSKSMNSEPITEFSFHPVQCDSEDSFLKKYRRLARRTSLFSIRPLHHQIAPLSQNFSADNCKSNIALNDVVEYENITSKASQRQGFGSIQRKLRTELDERMNRFKAGWRKGQVQPMTEQSIDGGCNEGDKKMSGKKRLSSTISESDRTISEHLMGFTLDDANMLLRALEDNTKSVP